MVVRIARKGTVSMRETAIRRLLKSYMNGIKSVSGVMRDLRRGRAVSIEIDDLDVGDFTDDAEHGRMGISVSPLD